MMNAAEFFTLAQQFQKPYEKLLGRIADSCGISRIELDILLFLHNNPQFDTAHDIVQVRGIAKSHVSKAVELLYIRGFLDAEVDKNDRRVVRLKLLPAADPAIHAGKKAQQSFVQSIFSGVSENDLNALQRVLEQINQNLRLM